MKWVFAFFWSFSLIFLTFFGVSCIYGRLYPIKYINEISSACNSFGVDEAVVYSLINVESHFDKNAVSQKGAVGLMQILPSTAKELAKELSLKSYTLEEPKDNILLGTFYLSILFKQFESKTSALCAYNAGPANVKAWLKDDTKSDDGKQLKFIPFEETRNYVEKFEKNFKYYSKKLK